MGIYIEINHIYIEIRHIFLYICIWWSFGYIYRNKHFVCKPICIEIRIRYNKIYIKIRHIYLYTYVYGGVTKLWVYIYRNKHFVCKPRYRCVYLYA